jgi:hypothetical protein
MSWARGIGADGREIGYAIEATCDFPGCTAKIDRGLSYLCGGPTWQSGEGCGRYFCPTHLGYAWNGDDSVRSIQACPECKKFYDEQGVRP